MKLIENKNEKGETMKTNETLQMAATETTKAVFTDRFQDLPPNEYVGYVTKQNDLPVRGENVTVCDPDVGQNFRLAWFGLGYHSSRRVPELNSGDYVYYYSTGRMHIYRIL